MKRYFFGKHENFGGINLFIYFHEYNNLFWYKSIFLCTSLAFGIKTKTLVVISTLRKGAFHKETDP